MASRPRGDYGFDAPWVPWIWFGIAALYLVFTVVNVASGAFAFAVVTLVVALAFAAGGWLYVRATLFGKFEVWTTLLADLSVEDGAAILDLGCGRGAVSVLAARRFPTAEITGIDLWRSIDQSGNAPSATRANAEVNGVADRLQLVTGNIVDMPFADESFDLVVSSLVIHNIHSRDERAAALREAWRVLRPGGSLVIVDLPKIREYSQVLRSFGALVEGPRPLGWRMWWSGPWMSSAVLRAGKAV